MEPKTDISYIILFEKEERLYQLGNRKFLFDIYFKKRKKTGVLEIDRREKKKPEINKTRYQLRTRDVKQKVTKNTKTKTLTKANTTRTPFSM